MWKKEEPIDPKDLHIGCLNCSTAALEAPMELAIAVGFGAAYVTRGDELVYDGEQAMKEGKEPWTVADAEAIAVQDPDHDWRIVKYGPLHGEIFQRHGPGKWVCIESDPGFA